MHSRRRVPRARARRNVVPLPQTPTRLPRLSVDGAPCGAAEQRQVAQSHKAPFVHAAAGAVGRDASATGRATSAILVAEAYVLEGRDRPDGIRHASRDQVADSLVSDLPQLGPARPLVLHDPPHVHVARTRDAKLLRAIPDAAADLGDRKRLVVEPPDRPEESLVVPWRGLRHPFIVAADA
jgi:hypothetical protein